MFGLPGGGFAIFSRISAVASSFLNTLSTFFNGTTQFVDLGTPADLTVNLANAEFSIRCLDQCSRS
jgi:hypothetical protein